jgi:hypothetical protein
MKEFKVEKFLGINNVDPAEKCNPGELQVAKNVNITATGEVMTRDGSARVFAGSPHSPFAEGQIALFREGTELSRFLPDYSTRVIRDDILGDLRMHYLALNQRIYYSDEVNSGVTDGESSRSWGIQVPNSPLLSETAGNLLPGRYIAAVTHVRDDGEESGASAAVSINVNQGGIRFSSLPVSADPTVRYTVIYLTTSGGEVLYQAMVLENGDTEATYAGSGIEFKTVLSTQFLSPPPPGHMLQYFNGRIYIAAGPVVWYTEPYAYGLINLATNFMIFDSRVTVFAPVTDGIWVATQKKTQYLAGKDPVEGFKPLDKADHGALEGSQQLTTDIGRGGEDVRLWVWAAEDGICYGGEQGLFRNLTESKYTIPGTPARSASIINEKDEGSFFVVSLI